MLAVAALAERLRDGAALEGAFSTCAAKGFRFLVFVCTCRFLFPTRQVRLVGFSVSSCPPPPAPPSRPSCPQPRASAGSVPRRTSTAKVVWQCAPPDRKSKLHRVAKLFGPFQE